MSAVAKRFSHGSAASAKRKRRLPRQIVLIAIGVDQFDCSLGIFHSIWTILADGNFDCHETSRFDMKIAEMQLPAIGRQLPVNSN